jgi:tRNA A37 N6-isopentenylltransferase MiaA
LRYESRELLYQRIDKRVDLMLEAGLLEETDRLMKEGVFERNSTAAQAIGYKELLGYLRGEQSLDGAVEDLKRATRRYAKRQITWFGAKDYVQWINADEDGKMRSFEETVTDPALRESLFAFAAEHGNHALHERLRAVDPESADAIHENNVKRVVRALEIFESTGVTKTEMDRRSRTLETPYDACVIGLRYQNREILYRRIDKRVDMMLEAGLLEETERLMEEGVFERNSTAAQAIGYKELLGYLRKEQSLDEAVEDLKRATRRYAKRQITWFGAKDYVHWVDADRDGSMRSFEEILEEALSVAAKV